MPSTAKKIETKGNVDDEKRDLDETLYAEAIHVNAAHLVRLTTVEFPEETETGQTEGSDLKMVVKI